MSNPYDADFTVGRLTKSHRAQPPHPTIPVEFDVRTIMLDVVPGWDGCGVEVYAKNVGDVEHALTELYAKWEALADSSTEEIRRLRAENAALNERVQEAEGWLQCSIDLRKSIEKEVRDAVVDSGIIPVDPTPTTPQLILALRKIKVQKPITPEQIAKDIWPSLRNQGADLSLYDCICVVLAIEDHHGITTKTEGN